MVKRNEAGRERSAGGRDTDLPTLGRSLRRNKLWIVLPALVCCILASVFVNVVAPRYTGEAKVLVENGENFFTRPDKSDVQQAQLPDDEAVQSQVQLITSRDLARAAIERVGLAGNPEFDPLAGGLGLVDRLAVMFGLERNPASVPPQDRLLAAYYDRLQVFPVVKSRVITIEFTANSPELAARAANTIADLYLQTQSAAKRDSARIAAESLATLIEDLRGRAAEAETKADAFRSTSGLLVGNNNTTITAQQLSDLTNQLAQAKSQEADSAAKAKILRDMIKSGRLGDVPDVANNEVIRRISEQRVTLRADIAQQGRTLLPGHPHMQELAAQLQGLDDQLHAAAETAARGLENDAKIVAARVENLQLALDQQKKTASLAGVDQVQLNRLELQARLLKDQLEFNTAKYQEAVARENAVATPADARLISRAVAPQLPSFPKKIPIVVIATLAGLILSIGVLVGRELLAGPPEGNFPEAEALPRQIGIRPAFDDGFPEAEPATVFRNPDPWNRGGSLASSAMPAAPVAALPLEEAALGSAVSEAVVDHMMSARTRTEAEAAAGAAAMPLATATLLASADDAAPVEPVAAPAPERQAEGPVFERRVETPALERRAETSAVQQERAESHAAAVTAQGSDGFAAALRSIRRPRRDGQATRVLVTAPEGCPEAVRAALTLARRLAGEARAIIVDFDQGPVPTRTPALADRDRAFDDDPAGLAELLAGSATFAEIIHRDAGSRLHVVPAGRIAWPPGSLADIGLVLEALAETYDYVILYGPEPSSAITQALVAESDVVVLTPTAGSSTLDIESAMADLAASGSAPVFAVSCGELSARTALEDAA